jgi:predicted MPP superfamily phosphohydrolase
MRLAWATDIHLNVSWGNFVAQVLSEHPDALVITGDITEAPSLEWTLKQLDKNIGIPIYFVLGNHDYYGSSIKEVRRRIASLSQRNPRLIWLDRHGIVPLTKQSCLLGCEAWYDAAHGDFEGSKIWLSDFNNIKELTKNTAATVNYKDFLRRKLNLLGKRDADRLKRLLPAALAEFKHIYVATHVPPFVETANHQGKTCNPDFLPFFSCRVVGELLQETMSRHPDRIMTVLCGHTHDHSLDSKEVEILPNLKAMIHGADYGRPEIAKMLKVE